MVPSLFNPSLPRPFERVILCALEKNPRRRIHTVANLLRAFQKVLDRPAYRRANLNMLAVNMPEPTRLPLSCNIGLTANRCTVGTNACDGTIT